MNKEGFLYALAAFTGAAILTGWVAVAAILIDLGGCYVYAGAGMIVLFLILLFLILAYTFSDF